MTEALAAAKTPMESRRVKMQDESLSRSSCSCSFAGI